MSDPSGISRRYSAHRIGKALTERYEPSLRQSKCVRATMPRQTFFVRSDRHKAYYTTKMRPSLCRSFAFHRSPRPSRQRKKPASAVHSAHNGRLDERASNARRCKTHRTKHVASGTEVPFRMQHMENWGPLSGNRFAAPQRKRKPFSAGRPPIYRFRSTWRTNRRCGSSYRGASGRNVF